MFKLDGNLKFINIDSDYIKKLNLACPEVYYKSIGYDNKPYIGILINKETARSANAISGVFLI